MGIAYPVPEFTMYEFGNYPSKNYFDVDTVGVTPTLNPITIPSWLSGRISHAYLDVYFPHIINGPANENELAWGAYFQVSSTGGVPWTSAVNIEQDSLNLAPSEIFTGTIRFTGSIDLATVTQACTGGVMYIRWDDIGADFNVMRFKSVYCILRVFVKG